jgi:cyclin-dependent kinase-like
MLRKMRSQYVIDLKEAFRRRGRVYLVFEYMQKNVLQLIE